MKSTDEKRENWFKKNEYILRNPDQSELENLHINGENQDKEGQLPLFLEIIHNSLKKAV